MRNTSRTATRLIASGGTANISERGTQKARATVDDERNKAMREFYQVYRPLQKKYNLRMHSHASIYDDAFIRIWEYKGEVRGECICYAKEEDEAACYRRAADELRNYSKRKEEVRENERKAG